PLTSHQDTFYDPPSRTAKKLYIIISYFIFSASTSFYSWTNDNPAIGLPASGTGHIPSLEALEPGVANITLTALFDACTISEPVTFTYTVEDYQYFTITTPPSQSASCPGAVFPELPL